jgi:hypothetical protein
MLSETSGSEATEIRRVGCAVDAGGMISREVEYDCLVQRV